jgi:hypothetical protein
MFIVNWNFEEDQETFLHVVPDVDAVVEKLMILFEDDRFDEIFSESEVIPDFSNDGDLDQIEKEIRENGGIFGRRSDAGFIYVTALQLEAFDSKDAIKLG